MNKINAKIIIVGTIIILGIMLGTVNFFNSNVEYGDFTMAMKTMKKLQVKGEWVKDRVSSFDTEKMQFTFFMKDDSGKIVKVVLDGAKPNNFDLANSIVVKGKMSGDYFHATEVLTKCPSKYEGQTGVMKK
jgi:cytochrome c-type biogenesis protein CcmE